MVYIRIRKGAVVKTLKHLLIVLCINLLSSLNHCTSPAEPVAGGTSIPNQIAGIIRDTTGTPVSGAGVKLIDVLSPGKMLPEAVDSTRTGNQGTYRFLNIQEGTYAIEAAYENSLVLFKEDIDVGYDDTIDVSGTLVTGGTITGSVAIPGDFNCIIHIANSHHSVIPDTSGAFLITGIEPDTYILLLIAHDSTTGNSAILYCDTVLVTSDAPTHIGTLETQSLHSTTGMLLVDDFEDEDNKTVQGQYWWMFDDRYDGGNSVVVPFDSDSMVKQNGGGTGNFSAHCTFTFGDDSRPRHIGLGFTFGNPYRDIPRTFDLSGLRKIHFRARGSGCDLTADLRPELFNSSKGINSQSTPVTAEWTDYFIDVESLAASDSRAARNLQFSNRFIFLATGGVHQSGELWIDDILFEYYLN